MKKKIFSIISHAGTCAGHGNQRYGGSEPLYRCS